MAYLLENKKIVECKWVFTIKYKFDGSIERYKATLIAQGLTQTYRIDHEETFAPIAKLGSIKILLSVAANLSLGLIQLDIKIVFLNGKLTEKIYMKILLGFEDKGEVGKVAN